MTQPVLFTISIPDNIDYMLARLHECRDSVGITDLSRRLEGLPSALNGVCACGKPTAQPYLSECLTCNTDRAWKESSDFALQTFTEPTAAFCAYLWHWLGLDSPELRCAFLSFILARPVASEREVSEAERDEVRDLVNGWIAGKVAV